MTNMSGDMGSSRPGAVLFACNVNRVRSAMAEGLLKRQAGTDIFVDSCGVALPEGDVDTDSGSLGADIFAQIVMAEIGCDLSEHRAKTFEELEDSSFDLVISLTPESHARALELARGRAADIEYWPTPDPTRVEGSRDVQLAAYRQVRDDLAARIAERFKTPGSVPIDLAGPSAL